VVADNTPVLVHNSNGDYDDEDIYEKYGEYDEYGDEPTSQKGRQGSNQRSNAKAKYQMKRAGLTTPEEQERAHREIARGKLDGNHNLGEEGLIDAVEAAGGEVCD
jgi:hypothetical protein